MDTREPSTWCQPTVESGGLTVIARASSYAMATFSIARHVLNACIINSHNFPNVKYVPVRLVHGLVCAMYIRPDGE